MVRGQTEFLQVVEAVLDLAPSTEDFFAQALSQLQRV